MSKQKPTYSEAIKEIEDILTHIESSELDVDELAEKVKRISYLVNMCKSKLKSTEDEINKILSEDEKTKD